MNAPTLNDLRAAFPARDLGDEKMSQVRELLLGDFVRANEARISALEGRIRDLETGIGERLTVLNARIEAQDGRIRDLETGIGERLTVLNARIEALAVDHTTDRQAAFDELGKSVRDLGERIRGLSR